MIFVTSGSGAGEQYHVTIAPGSWYQQDADASEEYWYAVDITPSDFDSADDIVVSAANAETFDWLVANAYYELAITSTGFTIQAKEKPTTDLQIFFEFKARGGNL